jgi:hypothetical protein
LGPDRVATVSKVDFQKRFERSFGDYRCLLNQYFQQFRYRVLGRPTFGPQSCTQSLRLNLLSFMPEAGLQRVSILGFGKRLSLIKPNRKSRCSRSRCAFSTPVWNPFHHSAGRTIRPPNARRFSHSRPFVAGPSISQPKPSW